MIDADVSTLMVPDVFGNLPLHKVCSNRNPLELTKRIVESGLAALKSRNDDGDLPIMLAAAADKYRPASLDVIYTSARSDPTQFPS